MKIDLSAPNFVYKIHSKACTASKKIVAVVRTRLCEEAVWVPKENYESKNRLPLLTITFVKVGLVLMICEGGRMISAEDLIPRTSGRIIKTRGHEGEHRLKWRA